MSDTPRKTSRKTPAKSAKDKSVSKSTSVKHKHAQLVRDSFTMPEDEYRLLANAKKSLS